METGKVFDQYRREMTGADQARRDQLLAQARHDTRVSVAEYLALENLDMDLRTGKKR